MHPKDANSMAVSGLGFKKALAGTGWAVFLLLCRIGLRKQTSNLVGLPFLALKIFHSLDGLLLSDSTDH